MEPLCIVSFLVLYFANTCVLRWFIPVNILVSLIIGSSLELILIKLTRTPPHFYSLVVSCCSSGNYLFLLVIAPAVCEMSNSPFGDSSACSSDGETCALLSMTGGIYVWTYVCAIMARFANAEINLKMVFNPTTIAAVVGLIIRIVPPIRKAMIGDNALLRLIDNSASLLGEAAIPSIILLLGANLRRGLKGSGVSPLLVVRILAVRYILLKWAHAYTISQLLEIGVSESSYILLWTYVVASISVTLWTAFYMWLLT
ncbi:protein PIN-LIKES 1 [Citrus sinensis]|uniref:Protein PIN-LIKES 1 n=1 Tax=Citrus sinensis TaxID=2711 RepID=A0ACB8MD79_CITSI|nr:protein PIN-LIKES 1 [Citrus sinensis]